MTEDNKSKEVVISLKNVNKTFRVSENNNSTIRDKVFNLFKRNRKREIKALKNINLEITKGEFFGIIGGNGSGKSTLVQVMSGVYPADKGGEASMKGKYMRLSLAIGFNAQLSARKNVYINASIIGLSLREIDKKFNEIIQFAELEDFIDTKIKHYSAGMKNRLAFAIAVHAEADIFLMDEFFGGVGDVRFRKKAGEIFDKAFIDGRTIIHVSHNFDTIRKYCNRVLLLHKGEQIMIGKPDEVIKEYNRIMNL